MTRSNGKKIGIKDIAQKAGVSIGTVDRVLHMRGDVSAATQSRVMAIVEEYGYTPNVIARTLSSKKQLQIGIVIPDSSDRNPYWEMPIQGISKAAGELSRFNTGIIEAYFDASDEASFREAFDKVFAQKPDGMVLNPVFGHNSLDQIRQLDEAGIPYVSIEVNVEGIDKRGHFGQDAFQSGRVAASLVSAGVPELSEMQSRTKLAGKGKTPGLSEMQHRASWTGEDKRPELSEMQSNVKVTDKREAADQGKMADQGKEAGLPEVLIIKQTSKKVFSKHIEARINGFLAYFSEKANPAIQQMIRPVVVEIDLSLPGEPEITLDKTLAQHPHIKAVFVPNSRAFLFADFIEKRNQKGYFVVGYDIIDRNIAHLEKGTIAFLIGQRPHVQAYNAIMALSEHLLSGKEIPAVNYSQIDIINKENITYYKNN